MSDHPELPSSAFPQFFQSLYGRAPFQWQIRLAEQACGGEWPRYIKLPTSSGKTSCLDIAVFALAHQAWRRHSSSRSIDAARRIFFVVDRRIIVNEAFRRAERLKSRLLTALAEPHSPEYAVAWWLRNLAGNAQAPPLDCFELRGGIYRDDSWVRSLLQPTIVTSTVDQVGSRLLFRGYGVSDRNLPIHAALTANDALVLLDEAHCSNPFSQTMAAIARYRDADLEPNGTARWSECALRTPFRFIEMTATPPAQDSEADVFRLEDSDYAVDKPLDDRHGCVKPVRLEESNAKGAKQNQTLADKLVKQAVSLATGADGQPRCLRIAIVVNRVACAREAYRLLQKDHPGRVDLMIGRMRPVDRDRLTGKLQDRFQSGSTESLSEPHFVVATQCLEVGADLDFDGLVTQCASLDALRQRFGRLNRLGTTRRSRGVIVMAEGDKAPRDPDPIYGGALPATWNWLFRNATDNTIDFGVRALDVLLSQARSAEPETVNSLSVEAVNAPVLMPAHLDMLCQTGPRPALEPEIAPFLHGPDRGVPEIRVCWRADLPERPATDNVRDTATWLAECRQTLTVCPPSSSECLSVPLREFKAWLRGDPQGDDSGDLLGEHSEAEEEPSKGTNSKALASRHGVTWQGAACHAISGEKEDLKNLRPNSVVVLPAVAGGWTTLGHVPESPPEPDTLNDGSDREFTADQWHQLAVIDVASAAFRQSRDRWILRVHRRLMTSAADDRALTGLWAFIEDNTNWHPSTLKFSEADDAVEQSSPETTDTPATPRSAKLMNVREELAGTPRQLKMIRYPGGFAVIGPRISSGPELPRASFGDEFEEHNLEADDRIPLVNHLADVAAETERLVSRIDLPPGVCQALVAAAERHDLGKADLRFQAMLLNSSLDLAAMQPKLWAKSATGAAVRSLHTASPLSDDNDPLPRGFRHEMLSLELARQIDDSLDAQSRDLMLHAIAAHHGHARPFAPVVFDDSPPDVDLRLAFPESGERLEVALSATERLLCPAHRLDSGVSERFWRLNTRYGWWGLGWLESTLRLADWVASSQPSTTTPERVLKPARQQPTPMAPSKYRLKCVGLNGANPLGFLAALGLFRTAKNAFSDCDVRMRWICEGNWLPEIAFSRQVTQEEFIEKSTESLAGRQGDDHFVRLGKNINVTKAAFRDAAQQAMGGATSFSRTTIDFYSSFGSDALTSSTDENLIQDSAIRTMAGAGHQHFLETMRNLIEACTSEHIDRSLFRFWRYDDPAQTLSLRFDPADDNRYALRWRDPSGDPARKSSGSMLGANRLAIEALPMLQTAPGKRHLLTTGFSGFRSSDTYFSWPLWNVFLPLSVVRSLMVSSSLDNQPLAKVQGVAALFRSQRITVGKVRNFTSGQAVFSN